MEDQLSGQKWASKMGCLAQIGHIGWKFKWLFEKWIVCVKNGLVILKMGQL